MGEFHASYLLSALLYAIAGIGLLAVALVALNRLPRVRYWRRIADEGNLALAVLIGAIALGMAIIIAAAVH